MQTTFFFNLIPRGETTDPGLAGKEFSRDPERKRFSR